MKIMPLSHTGPRWHILQISDALDVEMASALAESVPVYGWQPQRTLLPWKMGTEGTTADDGASLPYTPRSFHLLRGYARQPWATLARTGSSLARLLGTHSKSRADVLVCTTPFMAPVAELWPGPVVYWLTDLIAAYDSARHIDVTGLDQRMCKAATLVCPNSTRLAEYLEYRCECPPDKIQVLPNATRERNLLPSVPNGPAKLPVEGLTRPVVGIIGNLAGNLDWKLLEQAVRLTPEFTWLFVGPVTMKIADTQHSDARDAVIGMANATFVGAKPYGELVQYARGFDVAVLPYLKGEPTYSGSSTRFYEHLAACRPMLATRGFEELLHKEPLLRLVDGAAEMVDALRSLQQSHFDDGLIGRRWKESQRGTWEVRAATMQKALHERLEQERAYAERSHDPSRVAAQVA